VGLLLNDSWSLNDYEFLEGWQMKSQEKVCAKKKRFTSAKEAYKEINRFWHQSRRITSKNLKRPIGAYECPICKGWHMTSKRQKVLVIFK